MPFSLLLQGYPTTDVPVAHVQGPLLQGMFLHLIQEIDPAVCERLHNDDRYRPYTLSPLGVGVPDRHFNGFQLPRHQLIRSGAPCYIRITFLEDLLFPTFGRYFLERTDPTFTLGETQFVVTNVMGKDSDRTPWNTYLTYDDLLNAASHTKRKISLLFLTPTNFRRGSVDFLLPDPRLVFQSYQRRFEEFHQFKFLPDIAEQIELHVGLSNLRQLETKLIKTKKVSLIGFTGAVTYQIERNAPPELIYQINLLADYAFFCSTGRKTTVGMGQTVRFHRDN